MKVLYAIQGTGNGHLSRARDIIPALQKHCNIDILVSGYQADVHLPHTIKYNMRGLSFIFGKKGGIDVWNTYIEANIKRFRKEINNLPVEDYDFVINDFEPVSAWACYQKGVPCLALSHQSAVLDKNAPKPKKQDLFGKFMLKNYAPSNYQFGLHFGRYSKNIFTPLIRKEIRDTEKQNGDHYTVYLPSYDDKKLISILSLIKGVKWQIFSKHAKNVSVNGLIEVYPISNFGFIHSLTSSRGILCGAGFETPAEALLLGKKLMVIPMKGQYEQLCNAAALKQMSVPVLKKLKQSKIEKIQNWVDSSSFLQVEYPNETDKMVSNIFESHILNVLHKNDWSTDFNLKFNTENVTDEELKEVTS